MIARGDLWWVDLGTPAGSEPGSRRPLLIVSADAYNRSRIQTVVGVAITSNLRLAEAPGNVLLPRGMGGLTRESVANVAQIVTVNKRDLTERIGRVDRATMRGVELGLRRVLAIEGLPA